MDEKKPAQNRGAVRPMPRGVRFGEGQKGNPGGRPKSLKDLEELARIHTPAAINALVEALSDPKTAVPAANALLDRAWGKPKQAMELSDPDGNALNFTLTIVRPGLTIVRPGEPS